MPATDFKTLVRWQVKKKKAVEVFRKHLVDYPKINKLNLKHVNYMGINRKLSTDFGSPICEKLCWQKVHQFKNYLSKFEMEEFLRIYMA